MPNNRLKIEEEIANVAAAIRESQYGVDTTNYRSITGAVRKGEGNKVPYGSVFTVPHTVYGTMSWIARVRNVHKVAGEADRPTLTIQPKHLLSVNGGTSAATFQFDRAEAFQSVETEIPANTVCKFTTIAYGSWAAGPYHFTATAAIPVGSKLCISGNQSTALTSLNVDVYASAKATTKSASYAISAGDGDATVNLGTWGTDANHPQRVSYGSNNEAQSGLLQFLNGDSGSGYMDSIWEPKTKYDMMPTAFTSLKGFLGGFPDEFRECLGLCAVPNITNTVYEDSPYSIGQQYTHNAYFFLPSRKEIYGTNENSYEDGESQIPYFANIGTTDADKLMYAKGATNPTTYWLRTPYAGYATVVRICYTGHGGALYDNRANSSLGVAPLAILA